MKLRNKKTGKIVKLEIHHIGGKEYDSLTEVNEEWEDYEEPKEYYINSAGEIVEAGERFSDKAYDTSRKEIGNYFETEEEAKKALEKLKTWKRLKDKGFKFEGWESDREEHNSAIIHCFMPSVKRKRKILEPINPEDIKDIQADLNLLFGGEE